MSLVAWNDSLSVGIELIDREHRKLVDLINELHHGVFSRHAKETLAHVLDELITYTQTHFVHEEKLFEKAGFPDAAAHRQQHADLTAEVIAIRDQFQAGETGLLSMAVLSFLGSWLVDHIQGSDMQYVPYLQATAAQKAAMAASP